jgi:hypothetical protein
MGEYVCHLGHQYHLQEQLGDNDQLIGSQNFVRSYRKEKKEEEEIVQVQKTQHFSLFLHYQRLLKKQTLWLIENKGFPNNIQLVVRDLWVVWVSQLKIPKGNATFEIISPYYTLIFCHIGAKILSLDFHMTDIQKLIYETTFPFFEDILNETTIMNKKGLSQGIPNIHMMQTKENSILLSLSNITSIDNNIGRKMDSPITVLETFKLLQLPFELYPLFKELMSLHPKDYKSHQSTRETASVCLLLSKLYRSPISNFIRDYYRNPYSFKSSQIPYYPFNDYIGLGSIGFDFSKSASEKIAYNISKQYFKDQTRNFNSSGKSLFDVGVDSLDLNISNQEIDSSQENTSMKVIPMDSELKIKSYFKNDINGVKYPEYQIALLKLSAFYSIEIKTLETDLRTLEINLLH